MYNDITAGLRVPSQSPLDVKLYVLTYAELETLGTSDFKAFTYYKGITIYCAENEKFYRWRNPVNGSEVGVLASNYTYPAGAVSFGIDYSGQVYNLFPLLEVDDLAIKNVGTGVQWYQGFAIVGGVKYFNFRTFRAIDPSNPDGVSLINSLTQTADENLLEIAKVASTSLVINKVDGVVYIDVPSAFAGVDYYVNEYYTGSVELGTASKPFKSLQKCQDVILNRDSIVNPGNPDPSINSGNPYEKWELRTDQPFSGNIRVIIQSPTTANENLAINRVTYYLERGEFNSAVLIPNSGTAANLEYHCDMKELVDGIVGAGGLNGDGTLPYMITTNIIGNGSLIFQDGHGNRKGYVRAWGYNNGNTSLEQDDCNLTVGSVEGSLIMLMFKNPTLPYVPLVNDIALHRAPFSGGTTDTITIADPNFLDTAVHSVYKFNGSWTELILTTDYTRVGNVITLVTPLTSGQEVIVNYKTIDIPISREGINQTGIQLVDSVNYGSIHVENGNEQFRDSLFLNGTIIVNVFEQPIFYGDNKGKAYSDNGTLFIRPNYQHIAYTDAQYIQHNPFFPEFKKFYTPSDKLYMFHCKHGSAIDYAGKVYSQENTGFNQGGFEAAFCIDNSIYPAVNGYSYIRLNGGGVLYNFFFNSYIKYILHPSVPTYEAGILVAKNFQFDSDIFETVFKIVDTTGSAWTKIITIGEFINCYIRDYFYGGNIKKPLSNIAINTLLTITGSPIFLKKGMFQPSMVVFADNAAAIAGGLSFGEIYRDTSGNLKMVI